MNADSWIERLDLKEHPEGGFYSETYRNTKNIHFVNGTRSLATSIYFLLRSQDKSHFHQLFSDEVWYYHAGSPVIIHQLFKGTYHSTQLGIREKDDPQIILRAGTIFGAEVIERNSFCLMICMVNPGFDFRDFRLVDSEELYKSYPHHRKLIDQLTI